MREELSRSELLSMCLNKVRALSFAGESPFQANERAGAKALRQRFS